MQCDYYAFLQAELRSSFNALEQAAEAFEEAKQSKNRNARKQAEDQMKQVAEKAVKIEPHLAYLWYWAQREEANRFSEIANAIRYAWQKDLAVVPVQPAPQVHFDFRKLPDTFRFVPKPDIATVARLPRLSFLLHIAFRLKKAYLSKDERDFYLIDNPLRREKVFQMPMVASTSWKGALRAALWQLDYKEEHEITIRLFGNRRGSDEHQGGRLHFFPTFFDAVALKVTNPHDRKTGAGTPRGPILMECVPRGTTGELVLLYVPFGPMGRSEDEKRAENKRRAQVAQDLEVLAKGIQAMLTTYGFGAKTSSGYGVADEDVEGTLLINLPYISDIPESGDLASPAYELPEDAFLEKYMDKSGNVKPEFRGSGEGGLMSNSEYKAQGQFLGGGSLSEFKRFRSWYFKHGERWRAFLATQDSGSLESPPVSKLIFHTMGELCQVAQQVAERLREGGEV